VLELANVFRARVVDVAHDSLTIEITGTEDKIDSLLEVLRPLEAKDQFQSRSSTVRITTRPRKTYRIQSRILTERAGYAPALFSPPLPARESDSNIRCKSESEYPASRRH
jgi:hypothetical protein